MLVLSFWWQKLTKEGKDIVKGISLIVSVHEEREWESFILCWLVSVKKEQCQELDRNISRSLFFFLVEHFY